MATAKLSTKYQIVVPREVRKKMQLHAGTIVTLYPLDKDRALLVKRPKDAVAALEGLGREVWESLGGTDTYIRKERTLWQKKLA
ncbi:AbrB/MazE/SpoVT family DNA-binding domain-containing protein [Candidatus Uhrbacteria bacterium]|nr:AbrB/MazE/SpoVT family DNA-binding domain-containing protein [Candidatus Uhrbacteria bacterium]